MKLWEVVNILMNSLFEHGFIKVYFKTKDGINHEIKGEFLNRSISDPPFIELISDDGVITSCGDLIDILLSYERYLGSEDIKVCYDRGYPIDFIDYEKDGDFEGIVMRSYIGS